MPVIKSTYSASPYFLGNGHLETIVPSVFNKVNGVNYVRERLEMEDGDFLDLDWLNGNNDRLMILSHGMEGDSHRHYMKRFGKFFHSKNWDILAWNYRSCSGEMNRLPKFYSYGDTEDLSTVINYALNKKYNRVVLVGFSMGGGLVARYLGLNKPDNRITHAIVFSVSCDLKNSANEVEKPKHIVYSRSYINKLKEKLREKAKQFDSFKHIPIDSIKSFTDFHIHYSLPYHNYDNIEDFYQCSSSGPHLKNISIPTLMINALNDPILGDKCYPYEAANNNPYLYLETPKYGGHLGFNIKGNPNSYMEISADNFLATH